MVLILPILLTSCLGKEDSSTTSVTSQTSENSEKEAVLFEDLPDYDGNAKEFVFLVRGLEAGERYQSVEIGAEELTNELINDAVYNRNKLVEDHFNVKIKTIATGVGESIVTNIRTHDFAGEVEYHVVMPTMDTAAVLAGEGLFLDLKSEAITKNLDLSKEWWDQRANEDLTIGGKLFFTTGHISVLDNACTSVIIFNKTIVDELKLENPYDLVKDDKWTIDKLHELAREVTEDSDGSGDMNYKDTWGFVTALGAPNSIIVGAGERFVGKDSNDLPSLVMGGQRYLSVLDKYADLLGDKQATLSVADITSEQITETGFSDGYYVASDIFGSNRALFRTIVLADLFELADYNVSYGILPPPKYDDNQDAYYAYVSPVGVPGVCIPRINDAPSETALIVSAMAEASTGTLNEAYYETMLKKRKVEDNDSKEMLDLIFENRVYDLGMVFNWADMLWLTPYSITTDGQNLFASQYEAKKAMIESAMQQTIDRFAAMS